MISFTHRDSKSSKRRQSAPPLGQSEFNPDATRNTKYIQDLERFNEYRQQLLENGNRTSIGTNTSGELVPLDIDLPSMDSSSVAVRDRNTKAANRMSLPAGSFSRHAESPQARPSTSSNKSKTRKDRRNIARKLHETSIQEEGQDDEIRLFEQQHCLSTVGPLELSGDEYSSSPPTRFYKKNEKPYHERMFSKTPTAETSAEKSSTANGTATDYSTPQRRNNAPFKPSRRKKSAAQSGPIPKIRNSLNCSKSKGTETDSLSEPSQFNGSYKNYDINSSSMYDECVISSKGYKGNMNKSAHTYQHVVNKHGDVVEYALPLVEEDKPHPTVSNTGGSKQNKSPAKSQGNSLENSQLIDENFKFLTDKCNLNFSDSVAKFIFNEPSPSIANKNVQITDLDKSEIERGQLMQVFHGRPKKLIDPLHTFQMITRTDGTFSTNSMLWDDGRNRLNQKPPTNCWRRNSI